MTGDVEERIVDLAAGQHGVVSRGQLLAAGLTSRQVQLRVETKRLRRLHNGVYLLGHLRGRREPPRAAEMAAVLACGPGTLISHVHAAALWDLAPTPPRSSPVSVLVGSGRTPTRRSGIVAHRAADVTPDDAATVEGIPVTAPSRTIVDLVRGTGLIQPDVNGRVHGYEVDFYWPGSRIAVEIDGFRYHRSRTSFTADRRRDARLFSIAGIRVLRFTWEQVVDASGQTLVTLTRALDRGAPDRRGALEGQRARDGRGAESPGVERSRR